MVQQGIVNQFINIVTDVNREQEEEKAKLNATLDGLRQQRKTDLENKTQMNKRKTQKTRINNGNRNILSK
jgi:hypothetical protein